MRNLRQIVGNLDRFTQNPFRRCRLLASFREPVARRALGIAGRERVNPTTRPWMVRQRSRSSVASKSYTRSESSQCARTGLEKAKAVARVQRI